MPSAGQGPVERATRAKLRRLGHSVQTEPLAASAVALARSMDALTHIMHQELAGMVGPGRGQMGLAQAALQLRLTMADLEGSAVRPEADGIDELNATPAKLRAV